MSPRRRRPLLPLCLMPLVFAAPPAQAQQAPTPEERARVAALIRAAALPGEAHARLAALEGTWHQRIRMRPAHGAELVEMEGTATNTMILGGRFLKTESSGGEGPYAADALLLTGHDGRSGLYTQVAFDSWGTYWVSAAGGAGEDGTITMSGEDRGPLGHTQRYDFILRIVDADTYVSAIVFHDDAHTGGTGPLTMFEITHTRSR
ncbi:MAG TPA: DUF1579 family protein [Longimicrobiales bacterium]|nr:DUF1579 family protein [Longimicrobiales bacterium]